MTLSKEQRALERIENEFSREMQTLFYASTDEYSSIATLRENYEFPQNIDTRTGCRSLRRLNVLNIKTCHGYLYQRPDDWAERVLKLSTAEINAECQHIRKTHINRLNRMLDKSRQFKLSSLARYARMTTEEVRDYIDAQDDTNNIVCIDSQTETYKCSLILFKEDHKFLSALIDKNSPKLYSNGTCVQC